MNLQHLIEIVGVVATVIQCSNVISDVYAVPVFTFEIFGMAVGWLVFYVGLVLWEGHQGSPYQRR